MLRRSSDLSNGFDRWESASLAAEPISRGSSIPDFWARKSSVPQEPAVTKTAAEIMDKTDIENPLSGK
jgi:hypothetical protein